MDHVDVLIVGAGLSGIGAAYHLQKSCPEKHYLILEGRESIGGTWDLFRYPGVRSDSDMYTLGYDFKPWVNAKAIADGPSILDYVKETAVENGIDQHILYRQRVSGASWQEDRWVVSFSDSITGKSSEVSCNFLFLCSGYYDYQAGYTPTFPGRERFPGPVVHPQQWTDDIDYVGKRVIVIGSGATAMTLVPEMSKAASHVTMLQRSPTYVVSAPSEDPFAQRLQRRLPSRLAYWIIRWKCILGGLFFYSYSRRNPEKVKRAIINMVKQQVGTECDVRKHFTPTYNPWDQRLCLVPDADLFKSIRSGKVSVVTDEVACFTETGVRLVSGEELAADLIVTPQALNSRWPAISILL